jgi:hypothetical protein
MMDEMSSIPEMWLSGPVEGVPALLQPAAHALIQARTEVHAVAPTVSADALWKSAGGATAGYHLLHMAGALDRLFTYARGEMLNDTQKAAAKAEATSHPELDAAALIAKVDAQIDHALAQLRATDERTLLDARAVGRQQLPTTVIGALFHGAEHTARHSGQFITTVKLLQS